MSLDDFKRSYYLRTVCEVTRELHDLVQEHKSLIGDDLYARIFDLLQEQMRMQKKMDLKLRQYKSDYETEIFKANVNHKHDEARRASA